MIRRQRGVWCYGYSVVISSHRLSGGVLGGLARGKGALLGGRLV
jgi:hypothetical protein